MSNGGLHYTNDPHGMRAGYIYERLPNGSWMGRPREPEPPPEPPPRYFSPLGTIAMILFIIVAGVTLARFIAPAHGQNYAPERPNPDHRYGHAAPAREHSHHFYPLPHVYRHPAERRPCEYGFGGEWHCR
jgi:hypothetical protein